LSKFSQKNQGFIGPVLPKRGNLGNLPDLEFGREIYSGQMGRKPPPNWGPKYLRGQQRGVTLGNPGCLASPLKLAGHLRGANHTGEGTSCPTKIIGNSTGILRVVNNRRGDYTLGRKPHAPGMDEYQRPYTTIFS